MKTIVCGVDGSPGARAALQVAASLGEQLETWLVPVYVLDRLTDVGLTAERVAANVPDDEAPDAQAEARGEVGDVAERLAAAASDESALMIVLGRPQSRSLTHMSAGALCGQAARADGRARTYRAATARRRPDAGANSRH